MSLCLPKTWRSHVFRGFRGNGRAISARSFMAASRRPQASLASRRPARGEAPKGLAGSLEPMPCA